MPTRYARRASRPAPSPSSTTSWCVTRATPEAGNPAITTAILDPGDADEALGVITNGFHAQFRAWGVVAPEKAEGERVRYRALGLPHQNARVVRGEAGEILAVLLTTGCGRRHFGGPLAVRPGSDAVAAGFALCADGLAQAREAGLVIDGVTFPASIKHVLMYRAMGMHIGRPILFMELDRRVGTPPAGRIRVADEARLSSLSAADQTDLLAQARVLTDFVEPGYDLDAEIRRVGAHGLGDTVTLVHNSRLVGFALCHVGPRSEAFRTDGLLMRASYQYPGMRDARELFAQLLGAVGDLAQEEGATTVEAAVDLRRAGAFEELQRAGFIPHSLWTHVWMGPAERRPVTPDQFILEELR